MQEEPEYKGRRERMKEELDRFESYLHYYFHEEDYKILKNAGQMLEELDHENKHKGGH